MNAAEMGVRSEGLGSPWPVLKQGLRTCIKTSCAATLHVSGLERVFAARRGIGRSPLILGYHRVVENFRHSARQSIAPQLTSVKMLERHLDWVGKYYDFVTLDEVLQVLQGQLQPSRPVAAVTFDDGYQDVYTNALPLMQRKGIPGAIFVVTELTGTGQLLVHDELYFVFSRLLQTQRGKRDPNWWQQILPADIAEQLTPHAHTMKTPFQAMRAALDLLDAKQIQRLLKVCSAGTDLKGREEFQLLDWEQLRSMQRQDFTVGSHTQTHALLAEQSAEVLKQELEGSRKTLEAQLGTSIKHLAYPDGRFDRAAVAVAAEAGYAAAYTICRHRDPQHPLLTIPRTMLWERACLDPIGRFSKSILSCQINGIFDPALRCQRPHLA